MKQIFHQILDFPQMVNQKVLNAKLNAAVEGFDSQDGIRCYVKTIYQIAALVFLLGMEYGIVNAAMAYFQSPTAGGIGMVGSILTFALLAYSAFPISQVIRSRGENLGGSHNGMVEFIFKDFVTTNIRILGEVMAIAGLIYAFNLTLSFVFDADLFSSYASDSILSNISGLYALPMNAISSLLSVVRMDALASILHSFADFKMNSTQTFGGDFLWDANDLIIVAGAYINVIAGLAVLYVNLAIYNFLYSIVAALVNFIPRLAIPLAIRTKSE